MALDPNIILGGNGLDAMGAITRGRETAFQQAERDRKNALAMAVQQNGAGLVRGDQGAVNALAAYDPQSAMQFQDAAEERRQRQARAQQAAAELIAQKGADAARAEADRTERILKGAAYFHANGDRTGYEEYVRRVGGDPAAFPFEQFPAIAASAGDVIEVWKNFQPPVQEPPKPMTTLGKLQADLRAGLITPEQYQIGIAGETPQSRTTTVDPTTGQVTISEGAGGNVKFTEAQSKDVTFATRARGALEVLEPLANTLASRTDIAVEKIPFGFGRDFQDPNYQVAKNAGDEFLQAILRKDTGAAITEQEQALYGETYLPRPGDGEAVLAAKAAARQRALAALEAGMNMAQVAAQDRALVKTFGASDAGSGSQGAGQQQGAGQVVIPPEFQALWDKY